MPLSPEREKALARQGRLVAIVIAVAFSLWLAANVAGRELGLPPEYAFLFDFAALGAFIWAIIVAIRLWRERRSSDS